MKFSHSLQGTVFILTGELSVIHSKIIHIFESNSSSSTMFISKKVGSSYAFFQSYYNYFYKILAAIHSFNDTVHFSVVKTCSHEIFPTQFLSAYFRTTVTVKQTSYWSSYIFRITSTILKSTFSQKDFFSEYLVVWKSYFFLITTPS